MVPRLVNFLKLHNGILPMNQDTFYGIDYVIAFEFLCGVANPR